jgi:hypothetical protein
MFASDKHSSLLQATLVMEKNSEIVDRKSEICSAADYIGVF